VLDLLEVLIEARGYGYERLDGNDRGVSRQQAIDRFSTPQVMTSDGPSRTASRMAL
jgi:SNF2 family DNA or RNA helicase